MTAPYDERIERFLPYFRAQMARLDAERMGRDLAILRRLADEGAGADPATVTAERTAPSATTLTPTATATPVADDVNGDDGGASSAGPGFLAGRLPLVGLVNLALTVCLGAYGLKRRQRSRAGEEGPS